MNPEAFPDIEGYRVLSAIGEGGMAQVFLAQQISVDRTVALKVLPNQQFKDDSFEKRFFREAQNAAKLSHQSIVPIYDYGISNGFHYIAMEYLPGGDLKKRMLEGLRITDALSIIKTIARALDYAAKKGLVHRDIKPENILFREDGSPVLSDFGIARQINSQTDITLLGSLVGTPRYMSPEQAQDYEVDHRSDLYSLGIILYEVLTGTAPFISDSAISVSIKHITELPPPLPPPLSAFQGIIDKVLAKHPEERFQSGEDLASALAQTEDRLASTYAQTVIKNDSDAINATEITRRRGMRYAPQNTPRPAARMDYHATRAPAPLLEAPAPRPIYKKPATLVVALLLIQAFVFAGWYWSTVKSDAKLNPGQYHPDNIIPGMADKAEELLAKARQAVQLQHLFEPHNDNAQYYLTTLLALVPHHATAREEISQLFGQYLNQAEALIEAGNIDEAETYLNQSSQISYYIEDTDIKERFTELYQSLLQKRQQQMIEAERSKKVEALLVKAEQALASERLTSPPGDNAFDYFQQVLLEAPQHELAQSGIQRTAIALLEQARKHAAAGMFPLAHATIAAAAQIDPDQAQISDIQAEIIAAEQNAVAKAAIMPEQTPTTNINANTTADNPAGSMLDAQAREQINGWLATAQRLLEEGHLITPEHDNALAIYDKVLALDFLNIEAIQGREKIGSKLVEQASSQAETGKYVEAQALLTQAARLLTNKSSLFTARQKIAELEKLNNINQLLAKAEAAIQANRLEYPEHDSAANHYRQVLALDATNIRARQGIEAVGLKYVELSRNALSKSRYSLARKLLEKARRYTTSEIEIRMAESFLTEAATTQTIQNLLTQAKSAEAQSRLTKPAYTNAMYLYQQVLALAPEQTDAQNGLTRISKHYIALLEGALSDRDFIQARELLEPLKELSDTDQYNNLRERVIQAEKAEAIRLAETKAHQERERLRLIEQNRLRVQTYLLEIDALNQSERNAQNNLALIERYQAILAIEPDHPEATTGLAQALEVEAKLAEQALNALRIGDAEQHMQRIQEVAPAFNLSALYQQKAQAIQKQQEIEGLAVKVETLLAAPYRKPGWFESHKEQRNQLIAIYNAIAQIRQIAPAEPRIEQFLARLDQKYASIVSTLFEQRNNDARDFINDTRNFDWSSPALNAVIESAPASR